MQFEELRIWKLRTECSDQVEEKTDSLSQFDSFLFCSVSEFERKKTDVEKNRRYFVKLRSFSKNSECEEENSFMTLDQETTDI